MVFWWVFPSNVEIPFVRKQIPRFYAKTMFLLRRRACCPHRDPLEITNAIKRPSSIIIVALGGRLVGINTLKRCFNGFCFWEQNKAKLFRYGSKWAQMFLLRIRFHDKKSIFFIIFAKAAKWIALVNHSNVVPSSNNKYKKRAHLCYDATKNDRLNESKSFHVLKVIFIKKIIYDGVTPFAIRTSRALSPQFSAELMKSNKAISSLSFHRAPKKIMSIFHFFNKKRK